MASRIWSSSTRLMCAVALLGGLCLVAFGERPTQKETATPTPAGRVRLAVLIVFDQMRGDYLQRWQSLFGEGGFRRLQTEGSWFPNCHYPYAYTVTACGHASILTGTSAYRHGVVGNEWYDRYVGVSVGAVESDRYQPVPAAPAEGLLSTVKKRPRGVTPERLLTPTLGDGLKEATAGRGRVVSLSLKDRSAVLAAGRRPNACYWFDDLSGNFVTSTYYRSAPHPWVAAFNRSRAAELWRSSEWAALPSLPDGVSHGRPEYLGTPASHPASSPFCHRLADNWTGLTKGYYEALTTSPFGNDLLLALAKQAIDAKALGQDDIPDLLCLSFSSNDLIGHRWGPDSQEVLDVTLRSDRLVRDLLNHLDNRVGRDNYVLAVTADHGVCPLPEIVSGRPAGRVSPLLYSQEAQDFLSQHFGRKSNKERWIEGNLSRDTYPWLYLNRDLIRRRGLKGAEVEEVLARWLAQQYGIQAAYTRTRLLAGVPEDDRVGQQVRRSFHPDRCGDVVIVLQPYFLAAVALGKGTTHGTPHAYDTHVPLLFYGHGIPAGVHAEAVTPQTVAAVFASLEISKPPAAEAPVPASLSSPDASGPSRKGGEVGTGPEDR